jgi:hypothetical protein
LTNIGIYNTNGSVADVLTLPFSVDVIEGRTAYNKRLDVYYKGIGVNYKQHSVLAPRENDKVICENPVFYYGKIVQNRNWIGKFGIFKDRYQPYFSDFIGSCGPKEAAIIQNSKDFFRSSVIVEDYFEYDTENHQSYYILSYPKGRTGYIDDGEPRKLVRLLRYMVAEGWNFPWDKAAIRDITANGEVHDVADLFKSKDPVDQYGTIYAALYSLFVCDKIKFQDFIKHFMLVCRGLSDIPFLALQMLKGFNVNIEGFFNKTIKQDSDFYIHLVGNYLLRGRNCAAVEDESKRRLVSHQYVDRFYNSLPEEKKHLIIK